MINVQPTIFIGLGDVGLRSISYLKSRINENHDKPLESVFLLSITLDGAESTDGVDSSLPYELLPNEHIALDLEDVQEAEDLLYREYSWLPEHFFESEHVGSGARAASRLAFLLSAKQTVGFLSEHLRRLYSSNAIRAMEEEGLEVGQGAVAYVIAALDDPVGSGLMLDAAYLIRDLVRRIGPIANTTGIFFLPDLNNLEVEEGADVYAALKELEFHMWGGRYYMEYTPTSRVESDMPPFNHGCFLLDTINEHQVALGERDEASAMLGEWLYQASLTGSKAPIDTFVSKSRMQEIEGRMAGYGSLGLSGYILPVDNFVDWSANKLGNSILGDYVLGTVSQKKVVELVNDFLTAQSLHPDRFKENVLKPQGQRSIAEQSLALLQASPMQELDVRSRREIRRIADNGFPVLEQQIAASCAGHRDQVLKNLKKNEQDILNRNDENTISMALSFLNRLQRDMARIESGLEQQLSGLERQIKGSSQEVNRRAGLLFQSTTSLPSSPIDYVLVGLGLIVAFLIPLFLAERFIYSNVVPSNGPIGALLMLLLVVFSFGTLVYVVWRTRDEIAKARERFLESLKNYISVQEEYLKTQKILGIMPDITRAIEERIADLKEFHTRLLDIRIGFNKASSQMDSLTGQIDFPLQRSLLTKEFIEVQYDECVGDLSAQYTSFLRHMGEPTSWLAQSNEELRQQMLAFGQKAFAPLRRHTVNNLLEMAPNERVRNEQIQRRGKELLNNSAPMWNYNRFVVGQDFEAYLTNYGLLMMDDPDRSKLDEAFQEQKADLRTSATRDPYRMQVTYLRQGLPLFGLRAFDEFRRQYQDMLQNTKRPLHISDDYLLVTDPQPYPPDVSLISSVETLFTVGRVARLVEEAETGTFTVQNTNDEEVSLAFEPMRAVAILGLQPRLAEELSTRVNRWVEETGKEEAIAVLEQAIKDGDFEDWEEKAIKEFISQLRS